MKYKLNGKSINVTDSWAAMTYSQYMRTLKLKNDTIEMLSILTGIEYETLKSSKIIGLPELLYASNFMKVRPEIPTEVKKIGKYNLPLNSKGEFDIQFESLAQFEDMRVIMQETTKIDSVEAIAESYAKYVSIYLQKLRDGEYDSDKADQMLPEVMEMPALEVLAAGAFFMIALIRLLNGTDPESLNTLKTPTKATGKRTKKRSGSQRLLTRSRKQRG